MSIVIKGVRTVEGKVVDVSIEGGLVSGVGKGLKGDEVIDGKGKLVLPGFVNAHTHSGMSLLRGYAEDLLLQDWLEDKIWPIEGKMGAADMRAGADLSILEMIKSGTTCFLDHYFHMDSILDAAVGSGIRAFLGYGMVDLGDKKRVESELKESKRFVKGVEGKKIGRVKPFMAPHSPYTCSEETLLKVKEAGLPITTHVAETRKEVYDLKKKTGKRPVEYLDSIGFLGPEVVMAHCVWVTKKEINLIAKSGASVAHCPVSNLKLASGGLCPVPELLEKGVRVGLGTDGAASNNSLDMLEEMKFASLLQKNSRWDPRLIPAKKALELGTAGGAGCMGLEYGIEKGKAADLILVDLKAPNLVPLFNPAASVVFAGKGENVDTVIVDGKVVMENRKVLTMDEEKVVEKANEVGIGLSQAKTEKKRKI